MCHDTDDLYDPSVPKLWSETIGAHRSDVRQAVIDAAADLVARHGLRGVTMSAVAERAGIGRATVYKYFPDAESILSAWHERLLTAHVHELRGAVQQTPDPDERLRAVLQRYAVIALDSSRKHDPGLRQGLHGEHHTEAAGAELHRLMQDVLTEAVSRGTVRSDIPVEEVASFCINALDRGWTSSSTPALDRLIRMTLDGIRPARAEAAPGTGSLEWEGRAPRPA